MPKTQWFALLLAGVASAAAAHPPGWDIHGFATQAWLSSTANRFLGPSDGPRGSFQWTEIGLNGRRQWHRGSVAGQLLVRNAGDTESRNVELDYLYADLSLATTDTTEYGVRLGRMRYQLGFFNATRDVALTRPSVILPQGIYFERARSLMSRQDGLTLYLNRADRVVDHLGAGLFFEDDATRQDTMNIFFGSELPGKIDTRQAWQVYWHRDWLNGWRTATAVAESRFDYRPPAGYSVPAGNSSVRLATLSLEYDTGTGHRFTQETGYGTVHNRGYTGAPFNIEYDFLGSYLQYTRYYDRWQWFLRAEHYAMNPNDRRYLAATFNAPDYSWFADTWSVGARYYLSRSAAVSLEFHNVDGAGWLPRVENPDKNAIERYWNLVAAQVSITF